MEQVSLNNGVKMPPVGYGSLRIEDGKGEKCVSEALEVGYRLIDTAQYYRNEKEVGDAIRASKIKREEIFVTTKTATSGYSSTKYIQYASKVEAKEDNDYATDNT